MTDEWLLAWWWRLQLTLEGNSLAWPGLATGCIIMPCAFCSSLGWLTVWQATAKLDWQWWIYKILFSWETLADTCHGNQLAFSWGNINSPNGIKTWNAGNTFWFQISDICSFFVFQSYWIGELQCTLVKSLIWLNSYHCEETVDVNLGVRVSIWRCGRELNNGDEMCGIN